MIPPMTHELGRHWPQPSAQDILLDDTHAVMSPGDFNALKEYSNSLPSGVYPGKMWKRLEEVGWLLVWYGESEDPGKCTINVRRILPLEKAA